MLQEEKPVNYHQLPAETKERNRGFLEECVKPLRLVLLGENTDLPVKDRDQKLQSHCIPYLIVASRGDDHFVLNERSQERFDDIPLTKEGWAKASDMVDGLEARITFLNKKVRAGETDAQKELDEAREELQGACEIAARSTKCEKTWYVHGDQKGGIQETPLDYIEEVVVGSTDFFKTQKLDPFEVKVFMSIKNTRRLLQGVTGFTEDEKQTFENCFTGSKPECTSLDEGQAICRQTTSKVRGTSTETIDFAAVLPCKGVTVRSGMEKDQTDLTPTIDFIYDETFIHMSLSPKIFEQLLGKIFIGDEPTK